MGEIVGYWGWQVFIPTGLALMFLFEPARAWQLALFIAVACALWVLLTSTVLAWVARRFFPAFYEDVLKKLL